MIFRRPSAIRQSGPIVLVPAHRFDAVGVAPLIDGLAFDGFMADKAFDSNSIDADLNERGAGITISQRPRRASPRSIGAEIRVAPPDR